MSGCFSTVWGQHGMFIYWRTDAACVISTLYLARLHQWQRDKTGRPNHGSVSREPGFLDSIGRTSHTHTQDVSCSEHNAYQKQTNIDSSSCANSFFGKQWRKIWLFFFYHNQILSHSSYSTVFAVRNCVCGDDHIIGYTRQEEGIWPLWPGCDGLWSLPLTPTPTPTPTHCARVC